MRRAVKDACPMCQALACCDRPFSERTYRNRFGMGRPQSGKDCHWKNLLMCDSSDKVYVFVEWHFADALTRGGEDSVG